ncbi:hypothetical protein DFH07DRAFT_836353 [Mycena maculata]|uniref:Uncharacterized protein n=1 Tax=Mycena maculata TaxID=230809 RepID=A0AAD7N262_9AGAR|nr:hypothetical protein DFH07DRAFT_836353 [Mycena maculata]
MPPPATEPVSRKSTEQPPTKKDLPVAKRPSSLPKSVVQPIEQKKASHRSSKPIINWFQRKLAGGSSLVKSKRAENQQPPVSRAQGRPASIPLRVTNRISSAPLPNGNGKQQLSKLDVARRKTISLNEDEDGEMYANDLASEHSSIARDSMWSPTSAFEADEDASMRPLPPSSPPSPSPSPSSSSYVSDPRTFRSMAASTKPTTLLSIDLNGNGMAHIAQAPAAPIHRLHVRSSSTNTTSPVVGSGASITFSALPPSPISVDASVRSPTSNPASSQTTPHGNVSSVQAPLHTTHHPRNNPRPSSPPLDNASVLTLASSAYAMPSRAGVNTPGWSSAPPSALGDSLSHFGGSITYMDAESTSQYLLGDDDVDASVRALRPRSSRRGSWESEASRWSARVQQGGVGTSSLARDGRSLWTSNSIRTGGFSTENAETYEKSDDGDDDRSEADGASQLEPKTVPEPLDLEQALSPKSDAEPTPRNAKGLQGGEAYIEALRVPLPASTEDLPAVVTIGDVAPDTKQVAPDTNEVSPGTNGEVVPETKVDEYENTTPNESTILV